MQFEEQLAKLCESNNFNLGIKPDGYRISDLPGNILIEIRRDGSNMVVSAELVTDMKNTIALINPTYVNPIDVVTYVASLIFKYKDYSNNSNMYM